MAGWRLRAKFEPPVESKDTKGGIVKGFDGSAGVETWADVQRNGGRETVRAGALSASAKYLVRVRRNQKTKAIRESWRMRDIAAGIVYQIREVDGMTDRAYIWFAVESGVAV